MKEVKNDPLLTIFQNSAEDIYFDKIENIENIPNFFEYITLGHKSYFLENKF